MRVCLTTHSPFSCLQVSPLRVTSANLGLFGLCLRQSSVYMPTYYSICRDRNVSFPLIPSNSVAGSELGGSKKKKL